MAATSCSPPVIANNDAGADAVFVQPVLAPPPPGRGIQLHISFDVPAGTEQQRCWYFRLPATQDMEIVRYEVAYNTGSHHMNLFRVLPSVESAGATLPAETGMAGQGAECFTAVDFATFDLVVGSQDTRLDWSLPSGVAYRLHRNSMMLMQSHFVNAATQATPGSRAEVLVNLWTAEDPATITQHLGTMFANNRGINLPPRAPSSFRTRCTLPTGGTVVAMTGHFHSRGSAFIVNNSPDGEMVGDEVYRSSTWAEPPFRVLSAPMMLAPNAGLSYQCDFVNNTDRSIVFGPRVETDEHCNLFAYYYPVDPDSRARYCF